MKKLVLTAVASLACLAAFAQGKVSLQVDSLHLAFYDPNSNAGSALAGQGVSSSLLPAGVSGMMADLYVGTSSASLSLISSTTFSAVPGKPNSLSVQVPGIPSGSVFMVLQVRDAGSTAETSWTPAFDLSAAGAAGMKYWGASSEITFSLGTSLTYPPLWGANGNWAAGTFALDQYGAGSKGAISVSAVPEPTSFALAGLGAAAMLIFRRRK